MKNENYNEIYDEDYDELYEEIFDEEYDKVKKRDQLLHEILDICELGLAEGDIEGKYIDEENLLRFNKANILIQQIFSKNISNIETTFRSNLSSAISNVTVDMVEFEKEFPQDIQRANNFSELVKTVDFFNISALSSRELSIYFAVSNVWRE